MSALKRARQLIGDAYYDERGMADAMRQDALVYATIAAAEAAQPRLIRVGEKVINLAHIVHVDFDSKDCHGRPMLKISVAVTGGVRGEFGSEKIVFRGANYHVVAPILRDLLQPMFAAEIDLPAQQPAREPQLAGIASVKPFT